MPDQVFLMQEKNKSLAHALVLIGMLLPLSVFPYREASAEICGDGILDMGEECDDGNNIEGDGCSSVCQGECLEGDLNADGQATILDSVILRRRLAGLLDGFCGDGVVQPPDSDADGVADDVDNCPYVSNSGQEDEGGVRSEMPDGIGNACQCGDVDGDGIVTQGDGELIQRCVVELPPCADGGPELLPSPGNCDVNDDGVCNATDGVFVQRWALGLPNPPGIGQFCANAQPGAGGVASGEECDDGNADRGDGCDEDCRLECGNGALDPGEECEPTDDAACPGECFPSGHPEGCTCPPPCGHDKCLPNGPLNPLCDLCVADICAVDPYCCNVEWDQLCVSQVVPVCGSCP